MADRELFESFSLSIFGLFEYESSRVYSGDQIFEFLDLLFFESSSAERSLCRDI